MNTLHLRDEDINEIARKHLNLETLERRWSDHLDFSEQAVWCIKEALKKAWESGFRTGAVRKENNNKSPV